MTPITPQANSIFNRMTPEQKMETLVALIFMQHAQTLAQQAQISELTTALTDKNVQAPPATQAPAPTTVVAQTAEVTETASQLQDTLMLLGTIALIGGMISLSVYLNQTNTMSGDMINLAIWSINLGSFIYATLGKSDMQGQERMNFVLRILELARPFMEIFVNSRINVRHPQTLRSPQQQPMLATATPTQVDVSLIQA